jgi:hypothetical protein
MIPSEVAREAALILANNPDRDILDVAAGRLHRLRDGIRHVNGRWKLSPAARRAIGAIPPDLAKDRFDHAHAVLSLALSWLDEPPTSRAA